MQSARIVEPMGRPRGEPSSKLGVRMPDEEQELLARIAKADGDSVADFVRAAVRERMVRVAAKRGLSIPRKHQHK